MRGAELIPTFVATIAGALIAAAALSIPVGLAADRGVALDIGAIRVDQELGAGGSYALPTIRVRNPGDLRTAYEMTVSGVDGQEPLVPEESWFTFTPTELVLGPGKSAPVAIRLRLPSDVEPGAYEGLVGAQIADPGEGVQVGARAAARVSFQVAESSWWRRWWLDAKAFLSQPWVWVVAGVLAAALAVWWLRRNVDVSIKRQR